MSKKWIVPTVIGLLLLAWTARAQSPVADPAVADDVAGIHEALDRLVVILEDVRRDQQTHVLIRRIELAERRISPAQSRLRSAENDIENMENELPHMVMRKEQLEEELQQEIRMGLDPAKSDVRRMLDEMETLMRGLKQRSEEAELRKRRYEDEIADARDEIAILDELLLELVEKD